MALLKNLDILGPFPLISQATWRKDSSLPRLFTVTVVFVMLKEARPLFLASEDSLGSGFDTQRTPP